MKMKEQSNLPRLIEQENKELFHILEIKGGSYFCRENVLEQIMILLEPEQKAWSNLQKEVYLEQQLEQHYLANKEKWDNLNLQLKTVWLFGDQAKELYPELFKDESNS